MFKNVEDESLLRYKEQLLGDLQESTKQSLSLDYKGDIPPPFVEIEEISILCEGRDKGPIVLNLQKDD